jgi:endonuclease-3
VHEREGAYDLSSLRDRSDAEVRDYLMSLPGIGPKTAAVVLSFALGRDAIPVDTHVHRVSTRLGLIPPTVSAERADRLLHDLVPDGLRTPLHVGLIRLGREICKAPTPRCRECPLKDLCPTAPRYL